MVQMIFYVFLKMFASIHLTLLFMTAGEKKFSRQRILIIAGMVIIKEDHWRWRHLYIHLLLN